MNKYKKKGALLKFSLLETVLVIIGTTFVIMPISISLVGSLLPEEVISLDSKILDVVLSFSIENYIALFEKIFIFNAVLNSLVITLISMVLTCFVSFFIAHNILKLDKKHIKIISILLISSFLLPFALILGVLTSLWENFRLMNTHLGMVLLYFFICTPFCIYVYIKHLENFPKKLLEIALVDGVDGFRLYKLKFLYLRGAYVISMLFCFVVSWNDILGASVFNKLEKNFTINQEILRIIFLESINKVQVWSYFSFITVIIIFSLLILHNYLFRNSF